LGKARLVPFEEEGHRTLERLRFEDVEFQANPGGSGQAWNTTYAEGVIDFSMARCVTMNNQLSMCKHVSYEGCRFTAASEWDKLSETLVMDQCSCDPGVEIGAATGYQLLLLRNCQVGFLKASPRQILCLGQNEIGSETNGACVGYTYNGAVLEASLRDVRLVKGSQAGAGDRWAWTPQTGKDGNFLLLNAASWGGTDGLRLQVPRADGNFEAWLTAAHVGMIVAGGDGVPPYDQKPWGYVTKLSAPEDGSALWLQLKWMGGEKPVSGNVYRLGRWARLDLTGSTMSGVNWSDPRFACQQAEGYPQHWGFPAGYPFT